MYTYVYIYIYIYDPGSQFADPKVDPRTLVVYMEFLTPKP